MKKYLIISAYLLLAASCGETVVREEYTPPPGTLPGSNPYETVTVTGNVVNLRQGPGTEYAILGTVRSGDLLFVTGEAPDWYRIYMPEKSLFAWIYADLTSGAEMPGYEGNDQ